MKKKGFAESKIIRQVQLLPSLIIVISISILSSIMWLALEHEQTNDVTINYHAASVQDIGRIRYEVSNIKNRVFNSPRFEKQAIDKALFLSNRHQISKSLHIVEQETKKISLLQNKYRNIDFFSTVEQLEERLRSMFFFLDASAESQQNSQDLLLADIDAVMLSLFQLERLHEIAIRGIAEEVKVREKVHSAIAFMIAIGVLISALTFKKIYDSIKILLIEQKETRDRLDQGLSVANDGIWDWRLDSDKVLFDDRYYTLAGYSPKEFASDLSEWKKRIHPDDLNRVSAEIDLYLADESSSYDSEYRFLCKNGEYMWIRGRGKISERDSDEKPVRFIGTLSDITDKKNAERIILHQAHFDVLTDLPNRFLSLDRLSQLLNEARRSQKLVAVLFLDLDDFKKINDSLGHETGDKLLIEMSERLAGAVRYRDTVGRLGGDEFIILLGGIAKAEDINPVADEIISQFRRPFSIDGRELIMTASVGISVFPENGDDASLLLRNADSAMYHAKERGRNSYLYFTDAMNQEVSRRFALEEQLHLALERREFTVFYQPQIEVSSGRILGAEALLRWSNPVLGNVSPEEFIPIAERSGIIIPLGQYVLTEAIKNTAHWQRESYQSFRIAVNLSPRQFRDPELLSQVEKTVAYFGIAPESLEFEITEGVLMSGHNYIDKALNKLSQLGFGIAMDDFGTGYSSLSYLRNYPFNVLKVDRSFINDLTVDPADRELVNAAIAMAHGLNLKVVAEGVETEEQLAYLKTMACDYAQGYLFGKPMCADDMSAMLRTATFPVINVPSANTEYPSNKSDLH